MMAQSMNWQEQLATDQLWMDRSIELAHQAGAQGEVPIGALILDSSGNYIAASGNMKEQTQDPTAHAEIIVLRRASQVLRNWYLDKCTLYVTLEPCPMCAGAILQSRISRLVYGTADPKAGAIHTVLNLPTSEAALHRLTVTAGIREMECHQLLEQWFINLRRSAQSPKGI